MAKAFPIKTNEELLAEAMSELHDAMFDMMKINRSTYKLAEVEAVIRFIKGKSYGENPNDFMNSQIGHWEQNLQKSFEIALATERERVLGLVEQEIKKYRCGEHKKVFSLIIKLKNK